SVESSSLTNGIVPVVVQVILLDFPAYQMSPASFGDFNCKVCENTMLEIPKIKRISETKKTLIDRILKLKQIRYFRFLKYYIDQKVSKCLNKNKTCIHFSLNTIICSFTAYFVSIK